MMAQVREEYHNILVKLKFAILSEEQALEEDTTLLRTAEVVLMRMIDEGVSIRTKRI